MWLSLRRVWVFVIFLLFPAQSFGAETCTEHAVYMRGEGMNEVRFTVDIADEPAEQGRGLMFVEEMPLSHGMLFIFEPEKHATFWMRNTLIPLDMLFIDASGRVIKVHENAIPHDETGIESEGLVRYVLEINGGLSEQLGITKGSVMQHPSIAADSAAWPCD